MSLPKQVPLIGETHLNRGTSLNPNAAEFVPFSLRASSSLPDVSPRLSSSGKHVLDRSESSISASSDDEARQYWQQHLPDDITPDFLGDDAPQPSVGSLSLAGLSLHHNPSDASRFSASQATASLLTPQPDLAPPLPNGGAFSDKMRYPLSLYGDVSSSASYLHGTSKPWDTQVLRSDPHFGTDKDGSAVPSDPNNLADSTALVGNNDMNPVDFLASQFTGFAADSLAEVYFANGCDLNLTVEMLIQLELQVDGSLNQNMNSKTLSAPNLTSTDFPALPVPDSKSNLRKYAGDEIHQSINPYGFSDKDNMLLFKSSSSLAAKGGTDFASAVRKLASQDSGIWKYDRNGLTDVAIGSSRSSHALTGSDNPAASRSSYTERIQGRGSIQPAPVWLETGDAVANLYSELREEARGHARIRNAYFEQARQAYLVGNKALAKELSVKGQLHNMQMKAAHNKAQESIYRQRNPISPGLQGGGRCQEKLIDLHGLHVSEAIHVLKQELGVLRNAAKSVNQRLHVYICVGTGHHTRGSRTPARLPIAVQRYLLEEEGLEYSEPQPGLLRVVLY